MTQRSYDIHSNAQPELNRVFKMIQADISHAKAAVGGTTITASTQFTGPGTGLTGTAASLTCGNATNASTLAGLSPTQILAPLASPAAGLGDAMLTGQRAEAGALPFTQHDANQGRQLNVMVDFHAKGDDVTDDQSAFAIGILAARTLGMTLFCPAPPVAYKIGSTLTIPEHLQIVGDGGSLMNLYDGRAPGSTLIDYTGTGPCFQITPATVPSPTLRHPYGSAIRNLVIKGTGTGSHGIRVSSPANIGNGSEVMAGIQIENVFVYGFTAGRGLEINWCFNNQIRNYSVENCGVGCTLNWAHNTTFIGGTLEQCLVGLDSQNSNDINLHGTILQGNNASRIITMGLSMPADFYVWSGGWVGGSQTFNASCTTGGVMTVNSITPGMVLGNGMTVVGAGMPANCKIVSFGTFNGTNGTVNVSPVPGGAVGSEAMTAGNVRTVAADYAGVGCRNYNSTISWFGGYEEVNNVGYLTEAASSTALYGKWVDLDASTNYWVQFGIGGFTASDCTFAEGNYPNLVGVFHTEVNYAAPCAIMAPRFVNTIPEAKKFTGFQLAHAGTLENFNPNAFRLTKKFYNTDMQLNGGVFTHGGLRGTSGFNQDNRESLGAIGAGTTDFSAGTFSGNIMALVNGVNITVTFADAARKVAGVYLRIVILNNHASTSSIITFSQPTFKPGAATYTILAQKARVFRFYYENGSFYEEGVDVAI